MSRRTLATKCMSVTLRSDGAFVSNSYTVKCACVCAEIEEYKKINIVNGVAMWYDIDFSLRGTVKHLVKALSLRQ